VPTYRRAFKQSTSSRSSRRCGRRCSAARSDRASRRRCTRTEPVVEAGARRRARAALAAGRRVRPARTPGARRPLGAPVAIAVEAHAIARAVPRRLSQSRVAMTPADRIATAGRRPSQQPADARTGSPRRLLCREAGASPCAPLHRPLRHWHSVRVGRGRAVAVVGGQRSRRVLDLAARCREVALAAVVSNGRRVENVTEGCCRCLWQKVRS
jgi:hypothetical protein